MIQVLLLRNKMFEHETSQNYTNEKYLDIYIKILIVVYEKENKLFINY